MNLQARKTEAKHNITRPTTRTASAVSGRVTPTPTGRTVGGWYTRRRAAEESDADQHRQDDRLRFDRDMIETGAMSCRSPHTRAHRAAQATRTSAAGRMTVWSW